MKNIFNLFVLIITTSYSSYSQITQDGQQPMSDLNIRIDHRVGKQDLELDTTYENGSGEKFTVSVLNYFISNITLTNEEGKEYAVPQDDSYFLVKAKDTSTCKLNIRVPEGKYTKMTFTIGVDSLRNTMDISKRTGVLDPSGGMINGMYWTWNSGYIFFKMEGTCDQAKPDPTGKQRFRFHIGGFGGYDKPSLNNIKRLSIPLSPQGSVEIAPDKKSTILLQADILKVFGSNRPFTIAGNESVMFGDTSKIIAGNYSEMFKLVAIKNGSE